MHCRHRDAEDPRDKVYALLGLLRDAESHAMDGTHSAKLSITPDYRLEPVDVYRQVSQELIEKLDTLDVLGVVPKSALPELPSWVTDWSVTDRVSSPLTKDSMDRDRPTHASKGTKGSFRFPEDGKTIVLNGCELTSVQHLADPLRYMKCTTALAPANLKISEPELVQEGTLKGDLVDSMTQEGKDPNSNGTSLEQLVATANKTYKTLEEGSQGIWRGLRQIPERVQGFGDRLTFARDDFEQRFNFKDFANTFETLFAWERFSRAPRHMPNRGREPTKQTNNLSDLYWQTLCAGTYQDGSVEKTKALFDEWSQKLQPVRSLVEKNSHAVEKMPSLVLAAYLKAFWTGYASFWPYVACANGRRLGTAANGWLCLLPGNTEAGDRIILARGGRVPLVIRPLTGDDGCFSFVGEAYIHGIMDGEAFVEDDCKDIRIR